MRVETEAHLRAFYARQDVRATEGPKLDESGLFFSEPEAKTIRIKYPTDPYQLIHMAGVLATLGRARHDFLQATLWYQRFGMWNVLDEGVAFKMAERMRIGYGQPASLDTHPVHYFRGDELFDVEAFLVPPMLIGWDALYVPSFTWGTTDYFALVSVQAYAVVVTRTEQRFKEALAALNGFDIDTNPPQRDRFCHPE